MYIVSIDKPHPWFMASILWKKVRLIHGRLRYCNTFLLVPLETAYLKGAFKINQATIILF